MGVLLAESTPAGCEGPVADTGGPRCLRPGFPSQENEGVTEPFHHMGHPGAGIDEVTGSSQKRAGQFVRGPRT